MRAGVTVGRQAELAEVDAFLGAISAGGSVLAIEGEPGIGKTTLFAEAIARAAGRGIRVLTCRPAAAEAKMSFAGLTDLLAGIGDDVLGTLPELPRRALAVALLRMAPEGDRPEPRLIGSGVVSLLRTLAVASPVLLAIDDAQWLDVATQRALVFAARRMTDAPVGLVCALRTSPAPTELGELERSLEPGRMRRLRLGPIDSLDLRRLINERLGRTVAPRVADRIARATHGNPFFALEVARLLSADGSDDDRLPVPEDVRSLTRSRVAELPAPTRSTLLLATVLAVPEVRLLDAEALAPAERAELVRVDTHGRIEFAHPLFAAALYAGATESQRRAAHRSAAQLVDDPEQRARHLAYGAARPDPAVAAELETAAGVARARGAPAAAAELGELARQMTPAEQTEDRARRTLLTAALRVDARDMARARTLLDELLAAPAPDPVRARGLRLRAVLESQTAGFAHALGFLREGIRTAAGQPELQAALDLDAAFYLVGLGDTAGALRHAESAFGRAELAGEPGLTGDALAVVTMVAFLAGEGLQDGRLKRALALEEPDRDRFLVTAPRYIAGLLQVWTGRLREGAATLTALRAERIERGVEGDVPIFSLYLAWAHLWLGDFDHAAALVAEDMETVRLLGDQGPGAVSVTSGSALVAAHRGELARARELAAAAVALVEALAFPAGAVWPRWALGLAELSAGNPAEAHAAMAPLLAALPEMGLADPIVLVFVPDEIEALIALGELSQAAALVELLQRLAARHDRAWALAAAARGRGLLAAARGETDAAAQEFEAALGQHARTEMPFERARTLLALGRVRRRRKQWAASRNALRDAHAIFARSGAVAWTDIVTAELARAGETSADPAQLTPTERRVAELAAEGLTNQEVADQAFLTVKGVESNLTRVYRKLGIRSRRALADALAAEAPPRL